MKPKILTFIFFIAAVPIAFFTYTFLHEMGHAIIGILCGGKIEKIDLGFNAHVSISNAAYNDFTLPLMNAGGVLLPLGMLSGLILIYKATVRHALYHFAYLFFSMFAVGSLLAWVIIPFLSSPPLGDDVTNFLINSNIHPMLISGSSSLLLLGGAFMIFKKRLFQRGVLILRNSH